MELKIFLYCSTEKLFYSAKNLGIKVNGDKNKITKNKLGKTKGKAKYHRLCISGYKNVVNGNVN